MSDSSSPTDDKPDPISALSIDPEKPSPRRTFAKQVIEENYLYPASAILVMLGSYLMMPDTEAKGTGLFVTLRALRSLQGYEALVILTCALIARRIRVLNDAVTLLLIELTLLLDPTFFSNSFFTMPGHDGSIVNFVCFALVPLKLLALAWGLRLKLSPQMFLAFLFASEVVYLGGGPLSLDVFPGALNHARYFYLFAWTPTLMACFLPSVSSILAFPSADHESCGQQQRRLRRFFLLMPLAAVAAHVFESAHVHWVRVYALHFAPLVFGLGIMLIKNKQQGEKSGSNQDLLLFVDLLVLLALFLSSGFTNVLDVRGKEAIALSNSIYRSSRTLELAEKFTDFGLALGIAGAAAAGVYLFFYFRLRYAPALRRLALLSGSGLLYGALKLTLASGILPRSWRVLQGFLREAGAVSNRGLTYLGAHPLVPALVLLGFALVAAYRYRNVWTWLIAGVLAIFSLFAALPGSADTPPGRIPEILQCLCLLIVFLSHVFEKNRRAARYVAAAVLVAAGLGEMARVPSIWTGSLVASEFLIILLAGLLLKRHVGYCVIAALQAAALTYLGWSEAMKFMTTATLVVSTGFGLFLAGFGVTLLKAAREKRRGQLNDAPPPSK